jgi:inward rectifier potassium channel
MAGQGGPRKHDEDFGFGSVVSRSYEGRLLNRDGSFSMLRPTDLRSLLGSFSGFLTMSWSQFSVLVVAFYVVSNALFALAYVLCGPGSLATVSGEKLNNRFLEAFFFSVHTFATIGYGNMIPHGLGANLLVAAETLYALLGFALITGLFFARFSRPSVGIVFTNSAVIAPYDGITAFEFRVINRRATQIINQLRAQVVFSRLEKDADGHIRRYHPLSLEREGVAFFPTTWTVVHPIGESSPLYGLTTSDLAASGAEFLIYLTGIDETSSQVIHARSSYTAREVVWNASFKRMFVHDARGEIVGIDMSKFHQITRHEDTKAAHS